jgi:Txe/YoeB family toxin of Txe-Axe toxin-antitoxin module
VTFKATEHFWRKFYSLPREQKKSVREKWQLFKHDPFDPRLGTHKINSLSARMKKTVWSVVIESDLRVVFVINGDVFTTIDLGTHAIYR